MIWSGDSAELDSYLLPYAYRGSTVLIWWKEVYPKCECCGEKVERFLVSRLNFGLLTFSSFFQSPNHDHAYGVNTFTSIVQIQA